MALICGGDIQKIHTSLFHLNTLKNNFIISIVSHYSTSVSVSTPPLLHHNRHLCICADPDLVQDRGVSWQNNAVLNESHPDPPGRPQLFLDSFEPVTLQLKVAL